MTTNRPLKVFLCHSSNDKPAVRDLYQKLRAESWIQPWLDEEELYPGQDWETEIEKAVESSDVVLVCLSNGSINKRGFVQKELRFALDVALEMPEETIFIVPLRLEECTPPRSLRDWQYADYFEGYREQALQRLLISLRRRAVSLDLKTEAPKPVPLASLPNKLTLSNGVELLRIPAGKFLMGSTKENKEAKNNERPQHSVSVPYDYWMALYPITNELYNAYIKSSGGKHPVAGWERKKDHPVVNVSWNDAMAYCQWSNNLLKAELPVGWNLRLPTEAEWEKAARGTDGYEYPWGDQFNKNKCNTYEGRKGNTTSIGLYSPQGDSPYGCADMSGNVWEWTHSLDKSYPYKDSDGREDKETTDVIVPLGSSGSSFMVREKRDARVLRGGSFLGGAGSARCAFRHILDIPDDYDFIGFRVVVSTILS